MDENAIAVEWQAWQAVVKEFAAAVGDINGSQYTPLVAAIQLWGEKLHALRTTQPAGQQSRAAKFYEDRYAKIVNA